MPWRNVENISQYGRIQLFRSDTGKELWRIDGVLVYPDSVFPSDDRKHLVIVNTRLGFKSLNSVPILQFYSEGKLLKSYTLKDIGIDQSKLIKSVSHAIFVQIRRPEKAWEWEWPLDTKAAQIAVLARAEPNPCWHESIFEIVTIDGQHFRFDSSTGKLLSSSPGSTP